MVGLGMGVWQVLLLLCICTSNLRPATTSFVYCTQVTNEQQVWFLEEAESILRTLDLENIADVDFSWFDRTICGTVRHGESIETDTNNIKIHFSKRNPADKLASEDSGSPSLYFMLVLSLLNHR